MNFLPRGLENKSKMLNKSELFIISAPSGAGKSTLLSMLKENHSDIGFPISHTTRTKRANEVNGKSYYFVSEDKFKVLESSNYFLESAKVFEHYYGTSYDSIRDLQGSSKIILLEIDWQGARLIKKQFHYVTSIFIMPPSFNKLEQRLINRNLDSEKMTQKRLSEAKKDMNRWVEYDYAVLNDDLEICYQQLVSILLKKNSRFHTSNVDVVDEMNNAIS